MAIPLQLQFHLILIQHESTGQWGSVTTDILQLFTDTIPFSEKGKYVEKITKINVKLQSNFGMGFI